jgi:hypothetical protein
VKSIKEKFDIWIYVYVGENLSSTARLKLLSQSIQLERYIARGGTSCISKLYHDYKELADLSREARMDEGKGVREDEYYAPLSSLVEEQLKPSEGEGAKKPNEALILGQLYSQLRKHSFLNKTVFDTFVKSHAMLPQLLSGGQSYPLLDGALWSNHKQLILPKSSEAASQHPKLSKEKEKEEVNLNDSSPFMCEITEINIKEKKKVAGGVNEASNIMD